MPRATRASRKSRAGRGCRPSRDRSVSSSADVSASAVNTPSSTALSSTLDPQKPKPSCRMASGEAAGAAPAGFATVVWVMLWSSSSESASPGACSGGVPSLFAGWEGVRRGDRAGWAADDQGDLLMSGERDAGRVPPVALAIDEHHDARAGFAVAPGAGAVQPNPPLLEELAEGEPSPCWRLDVQHACCVVGVQRRDARPGTQLEVPIGRRPVGFAAMDFRVGDVDPDPAEDLDALTVDEDVQVGVHVVGEE